MGVNLMTTTEPTGLVLKFKEGDWCYLNGAKLTFLRSAELVLETKSSNLFHGRHAIDPTQGAPELVVLCEWLAMVAGGFKDGGVSMIDALNNIGVTREKYPDLRLEVNAAMYEGDAFRAFKAAKAAWEASL